MKINSPIIALLLGFCVWVSCSNDNTVENGETNLTNPADIRYQIMMQGDTALYHIEEVYKLEDNSKDYQKENITKIIFSYPLIDSFKIPSIKDSVNLLIKNTTLTNAIDGIIYKTLQDCMEEFISDYKSLKKEMKDFGLPYNLNWFLEFKIDVLFNSPSLMSLRINKLEFTGGAHANPWTGYISIDMRTGKKVNLDELLLNPNDTILLALGEKYFRKSTGLSPDTNLLETHYEFNTGSFKLPDNFSVGKTGLSFHYNTYDLGPYSMGTLSFEIPYHELIAMIDKKRVLLEAQR